MLSVFTGNGKGKTTAALGQAIRALGRGKKIIIFQFIKGAQYPSGEENALKDFKNLKFIKGGKGFVGILGDRLPLSVHKKAAQKTFRNAKKTILSKKYDLVILDEINVALHLKLLSKKEVLNLVKNYPKDIELIFTGRNAPRELCAKADLVTEFKELKHYYHKGVKAKRGREF